MIRMYWCGGGKRCQAVYSPGEHYRIPATKLPWASVRELVDSRFDGLEVTRVGLFNQVRVYE